MRAVLVLILSSLVVSCVPSPEVSGGSSTSSPKGMNPANAPYIWGNKSFPKQLRLSSDFTNDETNNITDMGEVWRTTLNDPDEITWFSYGSDVSNISNNIDPDDLYDGIMGVYRTTQWPTEIPDDALAVTQLFGRRYNQGEYDEFVSIVHADIMVNYDDFDFYTDDSGNGYDLRTVVLHEMGHFLGLQHIDYYDDRNSSVMYPSIVPGEEKRVPMDRDIDELVNMYSLSGGAIGGGAMVAERVRYEIRNEENGEDVRIVMELKASGLCEHKQNGTVFKRHFVQLKK